MIHHIVKESIKKKREEVEILYNSYKEVCEETFGDIAQGQSIDIETMPETMSLSGNKGMATKKNNIPPKSLTNHTVH